MKKCLSCNIDIGGTIETCPVCQNSLTGDESPDNWPKMAKLKKQAFLFKLQLFIVLASVVIGLCLDFLLDINNGKHWSAVVAVSLLMAEVIFVKFLKKSPIPAKILNVVILHASMILVLISWYYNFLEPIVYIVIPIIMAVTVVMNFIFALIDKTENAMVYLLANIFAGIVAYIMLTIIQRRTLSWTICLMLSAVMFIGIVVFKGRKVLNEVQKRMNF